MLTDAQDAYGHLYRDFMDGKGKPYVIERDDGLVNIDLPDAYFNTCEDWHQPRQRALAEVRGRVLDIGCGAGRYSLYLQEQGHPVVAVDPSPLGIEVARERGVRDVRLSGIDELGPDLGTFDTIVMFGNNLSLLGTPAMAVRRLKRLHRLTAPSGRILGEIRDPYVSSDPLHVNYAAENRRKGRWGGQARVRVRYFQYATPWLGFLMLSRPELESLAGPAGWRVSRYFEYPEPWTGMYIALLEKA